MKIKIMTNTDSSKLEKKVNEFIEDKKITHIESSTQIEGTLEKVYSNVEKAKDHKIKYIITIIYED